MMYFGENLFISTSDSTLFKEYIRDILENDLLNETNDISVSINMQNFNFFTNAPQTYQDFLTNEIICLISDLKEDDYFNVRMEYDNVTYEYFVKYVDNNYLIKQRRVTKEEREMAEELHFEDPIEYLLPKYIETIIDGSKPEAVADGIIGLLISIEEDKE